MEEDLRKIHLENFLNKLEELLEKTINRYSE